MSVEVVTRIDPHRDVIKLSCPSLCPKFLSSVLPPFLCEYLFPPLHCLLDRCWRLDEEEGSFLITLDSVQDNPLEIRAIGDIENEEDKEEEDEVKSTISSSSSLLSDSVSISDFHGIFTICPTRVSNSDYPQNGMGVPPFDPTVSTNTTSSSSSSTPHYYHHDTIVSSPTSTYSPHPITPPPSTSSNHHHNHHHQGGENDDHQMVMVMKKNKKVRRQSPSSSSSNQLSNTSKFFN